MKFLNKLINKFIPGSDDQAPAATPGVAASDSAAASQDTVPDDPTPDIIAFVDYVVKSLVNSPDQVVIDAKENERGTVLEITCKKDEVRKIIGRNGKTVNAIRTLAKGAGRRNRQNVTVVVND